MCVTSRRRVDCVKRFGWPDFFATGIADTIAVALTEGSKQEFVGVVSQFETKKDESSGLDGTGVVGEVDNRAELSDDEKLDEREVE